MMPLDEDSLPHTCTIQIRSTLALNDYREKLRVWADDQVDLMCRFYRKEGQLSTMVPGEILPYAVKVFLPPTVELLEEQEYRIVTLTPGYAGTFQVLRASAIYDGGEISHYEAYLQVIKPTVTEITLIEGGASDTVYHLHLEGVHAVDPTVQIHLRSDTAANWTANNPVLGMAEMGYESDTEKLKIGDGVTAWNALAYWAVGSGDVVGPAGATDHAVARFDTATGKLIQNSLMTLSDAGTPDIPAGQTYNLNGVPHGHSLTSLGIKGWTAIHSDGDLIAHGFAGKPHVGIRGSDPQEITTCTVDATNITISIKTPIGEPGTPQEISVVAVYP
jgi:hypothetical protein